MRYLWFLGEKRYRFKLGFHQKQGRLIIQFALNNSNPEFRYILGNKP
jgi:hypothetical protein